MCLGRYVRILMTPSAYCSISRNCACFVIGFLYKYRLGGFVMVSAYLLYRVL